MTEQKPADRVVVIETVLAVIGVLVVLGLVKHLRPNIDLAGIRIDGFTIALAFQLYVPLYLVGRRGVTKTSLGLSWHAWRQDVLWWCIAAGVTMVVYGAGVHLYMSEWAGRPFRPRWPSDIIENIFVNLLLVGLAEELYFRGYLQERLTRIWPPRFRILGAPVGMAIVVASAVFALAHFVGEYVPGRLGPFFPGLVFGWLRAKTTTIVAAVGYHAFCNVFADALLASYR
ncbi:MAG: JDVT-CTERM system glutamic-type intramembrane protease [Myxococcota bacterium]